ncbi:MAG: cell division protein ZapB [Cytophagales bacterium]|nr:cell division protein ZapB [Cytophagales bacterium]
MKRYWMIGLLIMIMSSVQGQDIVYGNYSGAFSHRASTPDGYIDFGPRDANWAHIFTDRSKFLFNQPVYSSLGVFSSLGNNNLQLQTDGSTKMTILESNGYVGLGTSTPSQRLEVRGHALISHNLLLEGTDLRLGLNNARDAGSKTLQRAMVHNTSDRLFLNYDGDFEGGIVVQGPKTIIDGAVGVGTSTPQGKMEIRGTTTLGQKYTPENAFLNISSGSIGLLIDSNEIYGNDALFLGSSYSKDIVFRNVDGNGFQDLVWIKPSGNFGVGTSNPQAKVEIDYNLGASPSSSTGLIVRNRAQGNGGQAEIKLIPAVAENHWSISANDESNLFRLYSGSIARFTIDGTSGNVGIGTADPTQKLSVNGTIRSKEIICEVAPWPDYVFEEGYDLKSLSEIETFIKEEGHLPNIPSAEEVQTEGVALAEMNALLLEKIEELTLHVIQLNADKQDLNKELKQMQDNYSDLSTRIQALEE